MKLIETGQIYQAFYDAGIFVVDPTIVRRVVLELEIGSSPRVTYETFANDKLKKIVVNDDV